MPIPKTSIQLFIPHFLKHLPLWDKDFSFQVDAPYLSKLLRQHSIDFDARYSGLSHSLFAQFSIDKESEIPMAYYRYQTHFDKISKFPLLCADPVHLEAGLNDITLTQTITDLSDDDVKQLISQLNQHFEQDNLCFFSGSNQQWYLRLPEAETICSVPLENALYQNIVKTKKLSGSRNWQIILNEIQMILHGSEVNQRRELAGLPSINSVWLWGGGGPLDDDQLAQQSNLPVKQVIGGDSTGKTVAKAFNCDWRTLEYKMFSITNQFSRGSHFIILDQLVQPALHSQHSEFQTLLTQIDQRLIKPLFEQWRNKQIDLVINPCEGYQIHPKRVPNWQFWHKPPALLSVAQKGEKVGGCT